MIIDDHQGILEIILDEVCTIEQVEEDTDRLSSYFNNHAVKGLDIGIRHVQELDTAYFQLLLSLKTTAEELGIPFELRGDSPHVTELRDLYGVKL